MDRTLIVFDMDTHCLERNYHNPCWRNAYTDIQRILKKHGFTNIQGTVYLSDVGIKQAHGTLALQEVAARFEWFYHCASNIQFYELKDDFNAQFIVKKLWENDNFHCNKYKKTVCHKISMRNSIKFNAYFDRTFR